MKLLARIEKSKDLWVLLIASVSFFILRLPSLFEPYWYGDEGIYQVLGLAIRNGRLLYRDIWDNKPPFLYLLYSIFNSDQFSVRLLSLIFGILSVIVFFFLAKKLFSGKNGYKAAVFTTFLFSFLFSIPLLEGNIANAENFMILLILFSGFLIFNEDMASKVSLKNQFLILLTSGFLLSFAFLFKVVAVFDFVAFLIFLAFINFPKISIKRILKDKKSLVYESKLFPFIVGFFVPILITIIFFFLNGALSDFSNAALLQNVGYVGYGNSFIFSQGLLLIKLILLALFLLFIFLKRNVLTKSSVFIMVWFSFSLFNAFFSQRPYAHYLLVLLPSLVLLIGLIFTNKKLFKLNIVIFILTIVLVSKSFTVYGKTPFYYQNFMSFILDKKSVSSYTAFFDKKAVRDNEIVQFINTHSSKNDNIFLWGNSAQIYKMTNKLPPGRYTVAYHVTWYKESIKETEMALEKSKPKFIIVESSKDRIPFQIANYQPRINILESLIYERTF